MAVILARILAMGDERMAVAFSNILEWTSGGVKCTSMYDEWRCIYELSMWKISV